MPSEMPLSALPAALSAEAAFLMRLGLGKPLVSSCAQRALINGTTVEAEILADGQVREAIYYEALARHLGLAFLPVIDPATIISTGHIDSQLARPTLLRLMTFDHVPLTAIVPKAGDMVALEQTIARLGSRRAQLAVAPPSAIRSAVWAAGAERRCKETSRHLFDNRPLMSARQVLLGGQGFWLGFFSAVLLALAVLAPDITLLCLHLGLSILYLLCLALRGAALVLSPPMPAVMPEEQQGPLPVYTVLVALYREEAVASQLARTLQKLDWPASRLDIKLVCEADDRDTIAALQRCRLPPRFEIIEVPPGLPRTKPKALTYALAGARGDYLVIYDAEDRPHPQQLREAHARFAESGPELACLQAPLVIANAQASWISAMFALEYAALFRGFLPFLAAFRLPLPLGGTSNHFRMAALRACGAWDPYNVTEDADLGMRLYRCGYRSDVLLRPTLEDAPVHARDWIGQRCRWFKGWLQTWLVHMRRPQALWRDAGTLALAAFLVTIGGMLLSALMHPLLIVLLLRAVFALPEPASGMQTGLNMLLPLVDLLNILGSYALFVVLGHRRMILSEKTRLGSAWLAVPLYWLMMSWAAWRALVELFVNPFYWNKTHHDPSQSGLGTHDQA